MLKYLIELKNRFLLVFINYFSIAIISYYYKEILLFLIVQPSYYYNSNYKTNSQYFIFTAVTEIFDVYIKIIIFIVFQIGLLFITYHMFIFFSYALFKKEYEILKSVFKLVSLSWLVSSSISHCFLIPLTWNFFLSFHNLLLNNSFNIYFEAKIIEYFDFYIYFYAICNIYFQVVSLLFFFFTYLSISLKNIRKFRKLYYFSFILFSTLLSPDILSQCIIGFLLILFYEIFIFFILFYRNFTYSKTL